jgi:hypothetical protein
MKKAETKDDELRPEYDLKALRVRTLGPSRKHFNDVVSLEADAAEALPDVNSMKEESES